MLIEGVHRRPSDSDEAVENLDSAPKGKDNDKSHETVKYVGSSQTGKHPSGVKLKVSKDEIEIQKKMHAASAGKQDSDSAMLDFPGQDQPAPSKIKVKHPSASTLSNGDTLLKTYMHDEDEPVVAGTVLVGMYQPPPSQLYDDKRKPTVKTNAPVDSVRGRQYKADHVIFTESLPLTESHDVLTDAKSSGSANQGKRSRHVRLADEPSV